MIPATMIPTTNELAYTHEKGHIEERNQVIKYLDQQLSTAIQLGVTPTYALLDSIIRDIEGGKHWGNEWK